MFSLLFLLPLYALVLLFRCSIFWAIILLWFVLLYRWVIFVVVSNCPQFRVALVSGVSLGGFFSGVFSAKFLLYCVSCSSRLFLPLFSAYCIAFMVQLHFFIVSFFHNLLILYVPFSRLLLVKRLFYFFLKILSLVFLLSADLSFSLNVRVKFPLHYKSVHYRFRSVGLIYLLRNVIKELPLFTALLYGLFRKSESKFLLSCKCVF